MRSSSLFCGTFTVALLASALAWAQSESLSLPGFDLERLEANPGRGSLVVGSGELLVQGGWRLMALSNYQRLPLVLLDQERRLEVVSDRVVGLVTGTYAVLPWLEVGAQVPVVLWQRGADLSAEGISSPASQGLGTPVLQARVGLLSQRARQPVDLALDVGLGAPVGSVEALASSTGLRFQSRLTVGGRLGWLRPALEAGVVLQPTVSLGTGEGAPQIAGPEVRVGAALATVGTVLRAELAARASLPSGSSNASVEVLGGLRYSLRPELELFAVGGPGFGSTAGTPRLRVVAGLAYSVEPPPKFVILDDSSSTQLQLDSGTQDSPPEQGGSQQGRPVSTWELNSLELAEERSPAPAREPPGTSGSSGEPPPSAELNQGLQPFQPGPRERLVLRGTVLFEHGSSELPSVLPLVDKVAMLLRELPSAATVLIEGHSGAEGTPAFRRVLSLRRAQAVRSYLASQGVSASQIQIRGFGSDWPVRAQDSAEGRQLNRRAELILLAEPPAPAAVSAEQPL